MIHCAGNRWDSIDGRNLISLYVDDLCFILRLFGLFYLLKSELLKINDS